jgi:hypothetical protein
MDASVKEKIEKRAYELYLQRGGTHGYAIDDWLQAEKETRGGPQPQPKKKIGKKF